MKLFVYGTLKSGQENHSYCANAITIEPAKIEGRLFDYGEYPALILGGGVVYGELLTFADDSVLEALDELEEVDFGVYDRTICTVYVGKRQEQAWVYYQREVADAEYLSEGRWPR